MWTWSRPRLVSASIRGCITVPRACAAGARSKSPLIGAHAYHPPRRVLLSRTAHRLRAAGITAPRVLAAFAVAVVGLAVFEVLQVRGRHPMLPLSLFRSRAVSVAVATGFAFMVGYYGCRS
jgi:hypothetical protein